MSGLAFNAMWTAPPPPAYTDTVGVDPTDYVVLSTSRGDEALVHKECLMESPVLRFCFRKRLALNTEEVVVEFAAASTLADPAKSATTSFLHTQASPTSTGETPFAAHAGSPTSVAADDEKTAGESDGGALDAELDASVKEEASPRHHVTLKESLCTDNSVKIFFPRLNGSQLGVVVAYMYFKHHYNRKPTEVRPRFDIPPSAALEVMRVAKALNC